MIWQDIVFLLGSGLSIVFLAPTLRDASARVPLGTSLPSMGIGGVYSATFASLGMSFSATGSLAAAGMWSLIAFYRSPRPESPTLTRRDRTCLFVRDVHRWAKHRITGLECTNHFEPCSAFDGEPVRGLADDATAPAVATDAAHAAD